MKAVLIEPFGRVSRIEIDTYQELLEVLCTPEWNGPGSPIVGFNMDGMAYGYCNRHLVDMPINRVATKLCYEYFVILREDNYMLGNVVIYGPLNDEGDVTDISEELALKIEKLAKE